MDEPRRLSKADLLAPDLPEEDYPWKGGTIRIRALSREEALQVGDNKLDVKARERLILVMALVEPEIDNRDAGLWQRASKAGDLERLTQRIARMSGMLQEQLKEETNRFPDGSESPVRVLLGGEAGEDQGGADTLDQ